MDTSYVRGLLGVALSCSLIGCDDPADVQPEDDVDDHGHDDEHDHDDHGDHGDHDHDNDESEVITRLELTFVPDDSATPVVAEFSDPDGDGGISGRADVIALRSRTGYELQLRIFNDLVDPPEDVTVEIREEAEEHQVFFGGDAVGGMMTIHYADTESMYTDNLVGEDLAVGLRSSITTLEPGTGSFVVQLQHLPDLNGAPVKTPGLEHDYPDLPGWPDLAITFELDVS